MVSVHCMISIDVLYYLIDLYFMTNVLQWFKDNLTSPAHLGQVKTEVKRRKMSAKR